MPTLTVLTHDQTHTMTVEPGANLRRVLLDQGFSPYAPLTRRLNCGGRGLCATCGVWIDDGTPPRRTGMTASGPGSATPASPARSPSPPI